MSYERPVDIYDGDTEEYYIFYAKVDNATVNDDIGNGYERGSNGLEDKGKFNKQVNPLDNQCGGDNNDKNSDDCG